MIDPLVEIKAILAQKVEAVGAGRDEPRVAKAHVFAVKDVEIERFRRPCLAVLLESADTILNDAEGIDRVAHLFVAFLGGVLGEQACAVCCQT